MQLQKGYNFRKSKKTGKREAFNPLVYIYIYIEVTLTKSNNDI